MAARKKAARKTPTTAKRARKSAGRKSSGRKPSQRKATPASKAASASKATGAKSAARSAKAKARAAQPGSASEHPEIEALALLMEKHGLFEVSYRIDADGSKEVHVSRVGTAPGQTVAAPAVASPPVTPAGPPAAAPPVPAPAPAAPSETGEALHEFKSPMVGTFYRAASPEAPPFVSVGDTVEPSTIACIIEAMKVMNEINPDCAGEIVSIEVENGEAVEFGQTLMLLRPQ